MPVTRSDVKLILLYCPGRGSNSPPAAHRGFKHGQGVLRPNHSAGLYKLFFLYHTPLYHTPNTTLQVSIKNSNIKRVYVTKFLGILIDDRLNWKEHISLICSKLSKCIAIIYKAKQLLDKESLVMLYDSLFVPYLTYCSEIWGSTYKTNINCVYLLQQKVLRIVCNVDYRYHSNVLFKELRILKLFDSIELKTAMLMYKANKKCYP